jgi:GNAT superfamily N-acetyltransferase
MVFAAKRYVAEVDGCIVGWAALIHRGELCWLDDLWIEPASIGKGIGSRLFRHTADRAAEVGAGRMEWEAEPNAVGFYERAGGATCVTASRPSGAEL